MPQPSTRRSSLDSFLPQFAAPTDDTTQSGMIPNGDQGHVDVNDHASGANGHIAHTAIANGLLDESDDLGSHHKNGNTGHPMLETPVGQTPSLRNGIGSDYVLGTAVFESPLDEAPVVQAVGIEAPAAHDHHAGGGVNGVGKVYIGEPPAARAVEAASATETPSDAEQSQSPAAASTLPQHPAAGSLFTPYLVTEIRELRNRRTRRGFWRRLFG
jgi:hypothetical protein